MHQLTKIAFQSEMPLSFKFPYQANVIITFDAINLAYLQFV